MKRPTLNFIIDALALLVMAALTYTGFLLEWILPPGSGRGRGGRTLWGLNRHDFGEIHLGLGILLLVLLVNHVLLHWTWVCTTFKALWSKQAGAVARRKSVLGGLVFLVILILLIGGGLWWAQTQVRDRDGQPVRQSYRQP